MTNERTDHAAEALNFLGATTFDTHGDDDRKVALAQVHATLALVEQQRIANLIALSQAVDGNGWQAQEPLTALFGYTHPDPEDGFEGLHVRREIREGLGI